MLRLLPFGWFVYRHKRRAKRILKNVLKDHPLPRHRKRRIQSLALYAIADAYLHRQYRGFPLTHEEEVSVVLLGAATA
ncbi:MAG: hypothetical protein JJU02_01930, partial [Cryomorphaceae bacterium]|nr:hypothetical protein [Cryomorphaceae bacterium]